MIRATSSWDKGLVSSDLVETVEPPPRFFRCLAWTRVLDQSMLMRGVPSGSNQSSPQTQSVQLVVQLLLNN
jgi:hypothetical protein